MAIIFGGGCEGRCSWLHPGLRIRLAALIDAQLGLNPLRGKQSGINYAALGPLPAPLHSGLSPNRSSLCSRLPGRRYYISDESNRFSAGIKFLVNSPKLTAIYDISLRGSNQKHPFQI